MSLIVGCDDNKQEYRITDVAKPEMIALKKQKGQGNIYGYSISGKGQIHGEATISLMLNGKPYCVEQLSGNVAFERGGDWYSDSISILYRPSSVKKGNLHLKYKFKDL